MDAKQTKKIEEKKETKVYQNTKTNTYRVFLNFPTWVGMKVYEVSNKGNKIKCHFLSECTYQGESSKVSDLYSEIVLYKKDEWLEIKIVDSFEKCINCFNKNCIDCATLINIHPAVI